MVFGCSDSCEMGDALLETKGTAFADSSTRIDIIDLKTSCFNGEFILRREYSVSSCCQIRTLRARECVLSLCVYEPVIIIVFMKAFLSIKLSSPLRTALAPVSLVSFYHYKNHVTP